MRGFIFSFVWGFGDKFVRRGKRWLRGVRRVVCLGRYLLFWVWKGFSVSRGRAYLSRRDWDRRSDLGG